MLNLKERIEENLNILKQIRDILWLEWQAKKRCEPVKGDEPFVIPLEASVPDGEEKIFKFQIPYPRTKVYYLQEVSWKEVSGTEYRFSVDGKKLAINKLGFKPHAGKFIFNPPLRVHKNIMLRIKNKSGAEQEYNCYFAGFTRYK